MICPNCKCEYIRGVTQCPECDVPLVDALPASDGPFLDDSPIVPIWRGNDAAEFERLEEALDSAGIPFTAPAAKSSFSFMPTEPSMEVWVAETNQEKARKLLEDLDDRAHPDELTPEEAESLALPESDGADESEEEDDDQPPELPEHWYEDEPVAEVWNGDSDEFATTLVACLREVGIASHKFSEAGHSRLVVSEKQESRAREVVREVVDATPPE
jgi:hypothetical protein